METLKTYVNVRGDIDKIIKPYHNKIIVERDTPERFTASGFEIPGSFLEKKNTGVILSVGSRCNKEIQPGMHVLFGRNSGTDLTINDFTIVVMHDVDLILCMNPLKMFGDRLLIEPAEAPKMIKGIHIPDTIEEQPQVGIILHRGSACTEPLAEVGASVLFGKYAGMKINILGKEYLCIRDKDVFARLD